MGRTFPTVAGGQGRHPLPEHQQEPRPSAVSPQLTAHRASQLGQRHSVSPMATQSSLPPLTARQRTAGGPAPPTFSTLSQGNLAGLVSHLSNAPGRRAQPTGPGPPSTCCCPPASAPHHTRPCTAGLPVPAFSTPGPHCVTETLSPHSWMRILLHCSS